MLAHVETRSDWPSATLDELASDPLDGVSGGALGGELVDIRRCIDRLEGEFLRRLGRFDRAGGAVAEGAATTVSWLRARCGLTGAAASQRMRMARALEDLPEATESLCAGRAPFTNVSLIAQLAEDVGTTATRPVLQTLVTAAEQLDPARMRHLALVTRLRLDPDGALDRDNLANDHRWFACDQTFGGVFVLRGELDAEAGSLVKRAIDGLCSPAADDRRTVPQRRADALVDIATRHLQSGAAGSVHGQRPHLTLTASLAALQGLAGVEPAELNSLLPLHAQTGRRIACDAVRTLVTVAEPATGSPVGVPAGPMAPLEVGRATRTIPTHIRTALCLRDRGCRFPGCDRPPEWTDAHHIRHWVDHGPTELDNLVLLCRRHHRFVHERRWTIRMDAGVPVVRPPAVQGRSQSAAAGYAPLTL